MLDIDDNLARVFDRIAEAASRASRDPSDIELIAVSKTRTVEEIQRAIEAGVTNIGENRIQEAEAKFVQLGLNEPHPKVRRHFVGHLQRNKVKKALPLFDLIHSVDSLRLGEAISQQAQVLGKKADVLVEVNTSSEASKFGLEIEETTDIVERLSQLPNIRILGLMTVAAFIQDAEKVRPCFVELRRLSEKIRRQDYPGIEMKYLSMGMSSDFETAIEEGANMVRIGTSIFGERNYS